jgi:hypothetical protein
MNAKLILLVFAIFSISISSIANENINVKSKTRINEYNGIRTTVVQEVFTADSLEGKAKLINNILGTAFQKEASWCTSENICTFDYYNSNGDTARLTIDRETNTIILVTKRVL